MSARWFFVGFFTAAVIATLAVRWYQPATPPEPASSREDTSPAAGTEASAGSAERVELSDAEQQRIGIQTAAATFKSIQSELIAPARVAAPETALHAVSARVAGRIEDLVVNSAGQAVRQGQVIAYIYSPQIVTAAEEYKLAVENRDRLQNSKIAEAFEQAQSLVDAARRRLELWGLTADQMDSLSRAPSTALRIAIPSPVAGIVTRRHVTEGQYVQEGETLMEVTDLATIWIVADVYATDVTHIRTDQSATILTDDNARKTYRGRVTLIEPSGNPESRTIPVRIEVPNTQMELRPGMVVQARFTAQSEKVLTVPRSSVIDTGKERIVYVVSERGAFERRTIQTGAATDADYAIFAGLKEGERVVSHGAFLIDSQSRLTGEMSGMFGGSRELSGTDSHNPDFKITFRVEPAPPKGGEENTLHVSVRDSSNQPVAGLQVKVMAIMPAMPAMGMPEVRAAADLNPSGNTYSGKLRIPMAGPWNVLVEIRRSGQVIATYRTRFDAV